MGLGHLPHLQAMLDVPEEPIGVGEGVSVVLANVAAGGESREGGKGPGRAQFRVGPPMDELQQLDRELDIADAAGSPLDVVGIGAFFGAGLQLAEQANRLGTDAGGPDKLPDHRRENVRRARGHPPQTALSSSAWNSHASPHFS